MQRRVPPWLGPGVLAPAGRVPWWVRLAALFGDVNPSGRLPETFPANPRQGVAHGYAKVPAKD